MARTLEDLSPTAHDLLNAYHLGTLTTLRADGSPHVVAVGFTVDLEGGVARVLTRRSSQKAKNALRGGRAVVTNVDGPRWLSLEGIARLVENPELVREGERRYADRYREPRPAVDRVVIEILVDRALGSATMFTTG